MAEMTPDPSITCNCYYLEDAHCFLGHPGPEATCTSHKPPVKLDPAPLDAEIAKKFEEIDKCKRSK